MNWELHGSDGHFEIQDMDESRRVALVRFATLEEARLMTAAPKLLKLAYQAKRLFEDWGTPLWMLYPKKGGMDRSLLLATIAKIEGRGEDPAEECPDECAHGGPENCKGCMD